MNLAERLFKAQGENSKAQLWMKRILRNADVPFKSIGWDGYDGSLELHGLPAEYRLPSETRRLIFDAGFIKIYANHTDKWETHYSPGSKGWRVSYPHKRGENENGIWVEEVVESWPKEWFDTGYCLVKKPLAVPIEAPKPVAHGDEGEQAHDGEAPSKEKEA